MSTTTSPKTLTGTYTLDATHSRIGFMVRHAMVTKVRGAFNEVEGSGHFDAEQPETSSISLKVAVASIDTRNADRDGHLRSNDFLDIENHPTLTFTSTAVSKVDDETYNVTGDLTIKGVTKSISFDLEIAGPAQDPFGSTRIGLEGSTVINRKDWGITYNAALETGGVLIGEKVTLEFEVAAVKS